jgi:hypothetical protein
MRNDGRGRSQPFLRPISIASLARRRHAAQVPIQDPRVAKRLAFEHVFSWSASGEIPLNVANCGFPQRLAGKLVAIDNGAAEELD